jgi:hypothetical protein
MERLIAPILILATILTFIVAIALHQALLWPLVIVLCALLWIFFSLFRSRGRA